MSLDARALAGVLDEAMLSAREIEPLAAKHPGLTLEAAYVVQDEGIKLRLQRGEKIAGLKMGFTSEAKRQQMGLGLPIYGAITDRMRVPDGGMLSIKGLIHPKIEPEIAFKISRDLKGRVSFDEALAACEWACSAMEILDSRFTGFRYFSLPDVVADNCSSCLYVLAQETHDPKSLDVGALAMTMEIDGKPVQSAPSSAISGHPVSSIVQLCELLDSRGLTLPAGSIVMAGAATQAVQLVPGMKIRTTVEKLGTVSVTVADSASG